MLYCTLVIKNLSPLPKTIYPVNPSRNARVEIQVENYASYEVFLHDRNSGKIIIHGLLPSFINLIGLDTKRIQVKYDYAD